MPYTHNDSAPKPPALIASTVTTAFNEERERERRQLNLIVHNLVESNTNEGVRKTDDIKYVTDIFKFLGAKASVTKAIRLGKKSNKPRLLKITVDTLESKIFILRSCTNLRKADPSSLFTKVYITPDPTPTEREANQQLCLKLRDEQGRKSLQNKNGIIVLRRD